MTIQKLTDMYAPFTGLAMLRCTRAHSKTGAVVHDGLFLYDGPVLLCYLTKTADKARPYVVFDGVSSSKEKHYKYFKRAQAMLRSHARAYHMLKKFR
jgi:hypothetical protein